jgi:IS30 family transposase
MENILSTEEIIRRLDKRVLAKVVREVGVSKHTIYRLMRGDDVYYSTVKKLSDYLIKENP